LKKKIKNEKKKKKLVPSKNYCPGWIVTSKRLPPKCRSLRKIILISKKLKLKSVFKTQRKKWISV
jgi:hypothetical protein